MDITVKENLNCILIFNDKNGNRFGKKIEDMVDKLIENFKYFNKKYYQNLTVSSFVNLYISKFKDMEDINSTACDEFKTLEVIIPGRPVPAVRTTGKQMWKDPR